jgi:hypothetical protein
MALRRQLASELRVAGQRHRLRVWHRCRRRGIELLLGHVASRSGNVGPQRLELLRAGRADWIGAGRMQHAA